MPLIICKVELSLTWNKNCILSSVANDSTFEITDTKLYVPVVTLKTEDNAKLSKLLSEGFKRPIYQKEYKAIPNKNYGANKPVKERLDGNIQGVKKLFILAYGRENDEATENSHRKHFLPKMKIKNYNSENNGINFYGQSFNDLINQYGEVRKISTGQGDDYTTGSLLDYVYFKDNFRLITADLNKQKALDAGPKVIQEIISTGQVDDEALTVFYIFEIRKKQYQNFPKEQQKCCNYK